MNNLKTIVFALLTLVLLSAPTLPQTTNTEIPQNTGSPCRYIPTDTSLSRQPGDGDYTIRVDLISPESRFSRGSGHQGVIWSFPVSSKSIDRGDREVEQSGALDYIPGRDYQVTIASAFSSSFSIEAAYIIAVPQHTPESVETELGIGNFSPTFCSNRHLGAVELKHNFPKEVTFIWSAPSEDAHTQEQDDAGTKPTCIELRATVVPWDWHRMFYRNTGGLKRVLCPLQDFRRVQDWPNYIDNPAISETNSNRNEPVKTRSVNPLDNQEVRDGYSDSGFYGSEEYGSCSLQELPKPVRKCCACNTAIYRIIIQSDWQQQQHWRDWPTSGVPGEDVYTSPHFSQILGASHSPQYDLFHMGWYASPAVDAMCTKSDVSKMESEFRNQAGENILTVIRTREIDSHAPPEQRVRSALFAVNSSHHLISFLTRLVPSPDWCTGLSRIDVCLPNCSWPRQMKFRLEPWDAGVMSGNTYVPVEPVERLREPKPMCPMTPDLRPNAPFTVISEYASIGGSAQDANRLFGDGAKEEPSMLALFPGMDQSAHIPNTRLRRQFAPLGTVHLELLRINQNEDCSTNSVQDDERYMQEASDYSDTESEQQGKCRLSSWSSWEPCIAVDVSTCATNELKDHWSKILPRTQRTRKIVSTRADCSGVQLKEEKSCSPVQKKLRCPATTDGSQPVSSKNRLSMEACQSLPWGPWSSCINATCSRPGMIYRWRNFADLNVRRACEGYPLMSQVDTCWPPTNMECDPRELKNACLEEPPTSVRLCLHPQTGTTRYFYYPPKSTCQAFEYVPDCHLRALVSGHRIGLTRNVFGDREQCERLCRTSGPRPWQRLVKRSVNLCELSLDAGVLCSTGKSGARWYFDQVHGKCLSFTYWGCNGNGNNFRSEDECKRKCTRNTRQKLETKNEKNRTNRY